MRLPPYILSGYAWRRVLPHLPGVTGKVAKPITLTIDYTTLQKAGGLLFPSHTLNSE